MHKGDFGALEVIWEGAAVAHIEGFEPCKCSTIVDELGFSLKVLI